MPGHDIIVVGASAGGMEALQILVAGLPPDLPAALFVAWHMPAHSFGVLPDVLDRAGPLPAVHARDGGATRPAVSMCRRPTGICCHHSLSCPASLPYGFCATPAKKADRSGWSSKRSLGPSGRHWGR